MIGEAPDAAALRRVDELGPSMSDMHPDHRQQATHLVLLQHHEVEMNDAILVVGSHPLQQGVFANDLSNVLVYEVIPKRGGSVSLCENDKRRCLGRMAENIKYAMLATQRWARATVLVRR